MLGIVGMATVTLIAGFAAFVGVVYACEKLRLWSDAGLAAFIPMAFFGAIAAISASSLTFWLLL